MDNYTESLEGSLWNIGSAEDESGDVSMVIEFLNSPDSFFSFGEGLLRIINELAPNVTLATATAYIRQACFAAQVPMGDIASPATFSNWFTKGLRPNKGESSRQSMFALAFALRLSVEQTRELFHKVYLDRAFNFRDVKELIYYHCLANGLSWKEAANLLRAVDSPWETASDQTIYTRVLQDDIVTLESAGELIEYIHAHAHNFSQNNVTATQEYDRLFSKAKVMAREELSLYGTDAFYRKWKNGDAISNNLLYEIMTGENPSGKSGTTTRFKSANLPKEIKNRFPEAGTLSKSNMTYEERRKVIILLFSYHMWCIVQIKGDTAVYEYDDYKAELDACLDDCNFPPLYYGNPYDWLFLYCAQAERPLDTFREILSEVLESDFN